MSSDLVPLLPKVTIGRRAGAFCIDGFAVWLPSLLLGTNPIAQIIFFVLSQTLFILIPNPLEKRSGMNTPAYAAKAKLLGAKAPATAFRPLSITRE